MKYLIEHIPSDEIDFFLVENSNKEKDFYLRGMFTEADAKNRNNRIYPENALDREIQNLNEEIKIKRYPRCGVEHPDTVELNPEDTAGIVTKIEKKGKKYFGESKILKDMPKGNIIYNLLKENYRIGISSRAMGSIQEKENAIYVQDDLKLFSFDYVLNESTIGAVMNMVMESEYYFDNGIIKEDAVSTAKNQLKKLPKNKKEEYILEVFNKFVNNIRK